MKKYCIVSMGEEDALIIVNLDNLRPALKRARGLVELCAAKEETFDSVSISFGQFDTWRPFVLGEDSDSHWCEWYDLTPEQEALLDAADAEDRIRRYPPILTATTATQWLQFHEKYNNAACESATIPMEWCDE